jgi:hypothetical protein
MIIGNIKGNNNGNNNGNSKNNHRSCLQIQQSNLPPHPHHQQRHIAGQPPAAAAVDVCHRRGRLAIGRDGRGRIFVRLGGSLSPPRRGSKWLPLRPRRYDHGHDHTSTRSR